MNIQAFFNENTIRMLPKTYEMIKAAPVFFANQMINLALREVMQTEKPLDKMSDDEIELFEKQLEDLFRIKDLIEKESKK